MAPVRASTGALIEKLLEFDRLATTLDLAQTERLGIVNIPADLYDRLRTGRWTPGAEVAPELDRRLTYALPLMRRLASSSFGRGGASRRSCVGFHAA